MDGGSGAQDNYVSASGSGGFGRLSQKIEASDHKENLEIVLQEPPQQPNMNPNVKGRTFFILRPNNRKRPATTKTSILSSKLKNQICHIQKNECFEDQKFVFAMLPLSALFLLGEVTSRILNWSTCSAIVPESLETEKRCEAIRFVMEIGTQYKIPYQ